MSVAGVFKNHLSLSFKKTLVERNWHGAVSGGQFLERERAISRRENAIACFINESEKGLVGTRLAVGRQMGWQRN